MTKNSCKSWTDEDLATLDQLARRNYSMRSIGKILGRSENAVRNAFRNILFHQLLDTDASTVAYQYHLHMDELANDIVHPKYALLDTADDTTHRSGHFHVFTAWAALTALLAVGGAYYAHLVSNHW